MSGTNSYVALLSGSTATTDLSTSMSNSIELTQDLPSISKNDMSASSSNTPLDTPTNDVSDIIKPQRRSSSSSIDLEEVDIDGDEMMDYEDNNPLLPEGRGFGPNQALEDLATETGKSNLKMAFMNMANSIIGAGIIGQPYAIRQSGLVGGLFLLVSLTVVIDWTIRLMVINAKMSGTDTFQATVKHCFGKFGLITISLAQGAFAFGGSMAFCVIIGDTIPHVVSALFPGLASIPILNLLVKRNPVIIICTTFISYPLALNNDISKLAKASALALVSMLIIVLTVVIKGPQLPASSKGQLSLPLLTVNSGLLQGVGVISFAFVCHHNSLLIYDSLKKPTMDRFAMVTHWSTGVSMVACITMGLGGFLIFKDKTKGNILNNFPPDDVLANIARFCFGLNMLTTLPLEIFVCREVILNYFYPPSPEDAIRDDDNHNSQHEENTSLFVLNRHFVVTTVLVFCAMTVSLFTCNLGVILEIVGSTSACVMAYVLPPMCFIKLTSNKNLRNVLPSYICVAFGIIVMIISTVQSIVKIVSGGDGNEQHCV